MRVRIAGDSRLRVAAAFDTGDSICETWNTAGLGLLGPNQRVPKWRNWQTRVVQVHVLARVWGFESLLRHQSFYASSVESDK
jgi:hypothetical protein